MKIKVTSEIIDSSDLRGREKEIFDAGEKKGSLETTWLAMFYIVVIIIITLISHFSRQSPTP